MTINNKIIIFRQKIETNVAILHVFYNKYDTNPRFKPQRMFSFNNYDSKLYFTLLLSNPYFFCCYLFLGHVIISLSSTSSIPTVLAIVNSEDDPPMKLVSNYTVVPVCARGGIIIFTLNLLFFSKINYSFSVIGTATGFSCHPPILRKKNLP